ELHPVPFRLSQSLLSRSPRPLAAKNTPAVSSASVFAHQRPLLLILFSARLYAIVACSSSVIVLACLTTHIQATSLPICMTPSSLSSGVLLSHLSNQRPGASCSGLHRNLWPLSILISPPSSSHRSTVLSLS